MSEGKCRSCFYHCLRTDTCDYLLRTGHSRGCPPDKCDKYFPSKESTVLIDAGLGILRLPVRAQKMAELYEQGLSDSAIAKAVGVSRKAVWRWRKKSGLPSQKDVEDSIDED